MDDHFRSMLDTKVSNSIKDSNNLSDSIIRFIPSFDGFNGSKPGYYFTNGSKGLGYYYDPKQKDSLSSVDESNLSNLKRKRNDFEVEERVTKDPKDINEILENAEKSGVTPLDATSIKQLLINFDKKISKNQNIRMKYPDEPEKFMDTEIELHEQVQELFAIAAYPDLYHIVVQHGTIESILGLITHENTDISIGAISLLNELLDPDTIAEDDNAIVLVDEFINQQGLELITQNLSRLDDTSEEDSQGIFQTLSIIENLVDINKEISKKLTHSTDILKYIFTYLIRNKTIYNDNKLYVCEILSILLESYPLNQYYINKLIILYNDKKLNCIDIILQNISLYRKKDPNNLDEEEMINNLFLSLYALLLLPENQIQFDEVEGYELSIRCIKEKNYISFPSIKTISYAINKNSSGCMKFIDISGLKFIFPILLNKNLPNIINKKKINHPDRIELERLIINIINQLCIQLIIIDNNNNNEQSNNQINYHRLINKFIENEYEKIDCCCELFTKYYNKINNIQLNYNNHNNNNDDDDDDLLNEKIDAGLLTLYDLSVILSFVSLYDIKTLNKIELQLSNDKLTYVTILEIIDDNIILQSDNLNELINSLEDISDNIEKDIQNKKINNEENNIILLKQLKELLLTKLVENNKIDVAIDNEN